MNNKLIAVALSFVANAIMPSTDSSLKVKTGNLAEMGRDTSPAPYSAKSKKNFSKMIGRPRGKTPIAPWFYCYKIC